MRDYAEQINSIRLCAESDDPVDECCLEDCNQHHGSRDNMCRQKIMMDAADAIEELLAAVPKWISVEERLPKSGERVLIMFKPFEDDENISIGWLTKSGFDCYDDSVYFFRSVTHWMPLPEPPKEVQDG